MLTGLVEGAGLLAFQGLGWLNWNMAQVAVSAEIAWISPVFCLLLFGVLGLLFSVAARLFPSPLVLHGCCFVSAFLLFFDWLALSGRIRHSATLMLALGLATVFVRWFRKREDTAVNFFRRTLPWAAALTLLLLMGVQGTIWFSESRAVSNLPAAAPGAPNVLLIVIDTQRADHLSGYGYARPTSPRMDKLAQEGALYENAFAASSWTLPSHASLLTGRPTFEHNAERNPLDGRYRTIAEELRERGYRTAAISANSFFFCRRVGMGRGFIRFEDYFHSVADMAARTLYGRKFAQFVMRPLGYEDVPARKLASDVTGATLRWAARDPSRPFFAMLNYFDVHDPFLPPQPWRNKFSKLPNPGGILNTFLIRYDVKMTPEELQGEIDAYDGAIAYVDEMIGRLVDGLEQNGQLANTLVIITSDHGEMLGEHGLFLHRNGLHREVIRVPLILRWPGKVPAGARIGTPVTNAAVPATILDLLGSPQQTTFPGPSLAQLWRTPESAATWPHPLSELAQFPFEQMKNVPAYHGAMASLVSPQYHFITHEKFGHELFDWVADPQEQANLAQAPEHGKMAEEFAAHLKQRRAKAKP
jgi:arylsulfatase A-like enzyme